MIITTQFNMPSYLASALVNGDVSGLSDDDHEVYLEVTNNLVAKHLSVIGIAVDDGFHHSPSRQAQDLGVPDLGGDMAIYTLQLNPAPGFDQYIRTALWLCYDDNHGTEHGVPLDDAHDASDIDNDTLYELAEEFHDFVDQCYADDGLAEKHEDFPDYDQLGHDFWLSRNGHGTGFKDRGLGDLGDKLHELAKTHGSCHLYLGDDGRIYSHG
jgi:hypothetical protein